MFKTIKNVDCFVEEGIQRKYQLVGIKFLLPQMKKKLPLKWFYYSDIASCIGSNPALVAARCFLYVW